jgi:hypothetical protein
MRPTSVSGFVDRRLRVFTGWVRDSMIITIITAKKKA